MRATEGIGFLPFRQNPPRRTKGWGTGACGSNCLSRLERLVRDKQLLRDGGGGGGVLFDFELAADFGGGLG